MDTQMKQPYILHEMEGKQMAWFSATLVQKASCPELGLTEVKGHPGDEPPMHIHKNEDEWFYVIGGEVTFHVGGQNLPGKAGSFVSMPRGIPHTFSVESAEAHFLVFNTPGGFERMFTMNPQTREDAMRAMAALETEIVGPHPRQVARA
jgi:quercetin dioxygenase-like cupin family protein